MRAGISTPRGIAELGPNGTPSERVGNVVRRACWPSATSPTDLIQPTCRWHTHPAELAGFGRWSTTRRIRRTVKARRIARAEPMLDRLGRDLPSKEPRPSTAVGSPAPWLLTTAQILAGTALLVRSRWACSPLSWPGCWSTNWCMCWHQGRACA
jgi:hypothetical protein